MRNKTEETTSLRWQQNAAGGWAFFDGFRQVTGAYPAETDREYAEEAWHITNTPVSALASSFQEHAEFVRLHARFGNKHINEIEARLHQMKNSGREAGQAGMREFDGRGGRRYSSAMEAQAAREIGQETLLLGLYLQWRREGGIL